MYNSTHTGWPRACMRASSSASSMDKAAVGMTVVSDDPVCGVWMPYLHPERSKREVNQRP